MSQEEKKGLPKREFRAGLVRATIWDSERVKDGHVFTVSSVRVERRYKDKDGNWQSTNSFARSDLPLLRAVVAKAFEYLVVTERDPNEEGSGELKKAG